ncbi:MAG: hypothetical protein ISS25_05000 [Nanoarchaeota archaeon]|nr:hypothetical protein [DPANN group archaeon]MBL7117157.1 hypothetical protein [Nanoarchaeota archaeon]
MKKNSKKGQAWSIDLIIGLLVFVLILVIFYTLIGGEKESKVREFTGKADVVAERLFEEGLVDPVTGEFNDEKFLELAEEDYEGLKERLGIVGDFCLFIEGKTFDGRPYIKFILDDTSEGWTSIGSSDLDISDFQCGEKWP